MKYNNNNILEVFLRRYTGRFLTNDLMEGSPGINKNNVSTKRVFIGFLFTTFEPKFRRIFPLSSGFKRPMKEA